jgi:single-strand DNA-binding protein
VEKYATDIIATEKQLLGGREGMGGGTPEDAGSMARSAPAARAAAPAPAPAPQPQARSSTGFDDMDDDIPF